jgi:hypothetical protein
MDGHRRSRVFTVAGTLWSISTPRVRLNSTARSPRSSSQAQLARSWPESAGAPLCPRRRPPLPRSLAFEAGRVRVLCTVECGLSRRSSRVSRYHRGGHQRRERAGQRRSPESCAADEWGPADPRAHLSVPLCGSGVRERGERSDFSGWFLKSFEK